MVTSAVPPRWRAYSQLNKAVRAVPMCMAPVGDGAADEFLIAADAVHVRGVEEGHAKLDGTMDRGDGLGLVAAAVELGHAHAAEAEGGYLQLTKLTLLHRTISGSGRTTGPRAGRRARHQLV